MLTLDPVGEPVRRSDDDMLGRLTAIDHRLHQISTQLTTMGKLLSQLDEICANLETLGRRVDRDPPLLSADAAARALQEYFLANADNAANDELVAEMTRRIRALRAAREGGC